MEKKWSFTSVMLVCAVLAFTSCKKKSDEPTPGDNRSNTDKKEQNPGFDLLMQSDWDKTVAGSMISDAIPDEKTKPRLLTIPKGRGK